MDIMTCCLGSLFTVYYIYAMHFFFLSIFIYLLSSVYFVPVQCILLEFPLGINKVLSSLILSCSLINK